MPAPFTPSNGVESSIPVHVSIPPSAVLRNHSLIEQWENMRRQSDVMLLVELSDYMHLDFLKTALTDFVNSIPSSGKTKI